MRNILLLLPFIVIFGLYQAGYIHGNPDINDAVTARSIDTKTNEPKDRADTFRAGEPLYLCVQGSALVKNKSVVTVKWMLGGSVLAEQSIKADRDGKFWMSFPAPLDKVNGGNMKADVLVDGGVKSSVTFRVNAKQ